MIAKQLEGLHIFRFILKLCIHDIWRLIIPPRPHAYGAETIFHHPPDWVVLILNLANRFEDVGVFILWEQLFASN